MACPAPTPSAPLWGIGVHMPSEVDTAESAALGSPGEKGEWGCDQEEQRGTMHGRNPVCLKLAKVAGESALQKQTWRGASPMVP